MKVYLLPIRFLTEMVPFTLPSPSQLVYPESIYWIGGPLHPSDALDNEEVFHKEVLRKYNDSMYARIQVRSIGLVGEPGFF